FSLDYDNLEALKWLALVLMTGDHINRIILKDSIPILTYAGRSVLPIFAFTLAYSLAQTKALNSGIYRRVFIRLSIAGSIAMVPYVAIRGWQSLNILFSLLLGAFISQLILQREAYKTSLEQPKPLKKFSKISLLIKSNYALIALVIFICLGSIVEYTWLGPAVFLSAWYFCKRPSYLSFFICIIALILLYPFSGNNFYALLAVPIILLFIKLNLTVPRIKYFFYIYYPLHLGLIYIYQDNAYFINRFFKHLF
ncbi:MAG: hypothetical protein RI956_313, partial [Pseudomonadota bacterium]